MKLTLAVPGLLLAGCAVSTSMQRSLAPTNGDDKITVPNGFDLLLSEAIAALRAAG